MDCREIAFHKLPHQPKLFRDYLSDFPRVSKFYSHAPTFAAVKKAAQKLVFPGDRRRAVADILRRQNSAWGGGALTGENLDRLGDGAVAVVTGQQVGLFSGPAYAAYKALGAIQMALELTRAGIPAVPVFWMATEDHDLDEVRHVSWFHNGKRIRYELPARPGSEQPVGEIALGQPIHALADEAAGFLAAAGSELLASFLRESYRAEETYASAFGKLFARLFADHGLVLLDPLDRALHQVASPLYARAVGESEALRDKLLERGRELDRAGYAPQVKVTAKSTLLFRVEGGKRQVLSAAGGKFQTADRSWDQAGLREAVEKEPEKFSPNALFRPVVQDYLLPTVAYLAGPAEIAYFAQAQVNYRELLGRMPVILPRADFTLVDGKATKLLSKYELRVENLLEGTQVVRTSMEARSVPKALGREFTKTEEDLKRALGRLEKSIRKLDPTLRGAVETARKKVTYQLEKLRKKTGRAVDSRSGLIREHLGYLEALLYPNKTLQSRDISFLPLLAKAGMNGLGELQKLAGQKNIGKHLVVRIP